VSKHRKITAKEKLKKRLRRAAKKEERQDRQSSEQQRVNVSAATSPTPAQQTEERNASL